MPQEIERKFLVSGDFTSSPVAGPPREFVQGYIFDDGQTSARIRVIDAADGVLTFKVASDDPRVRTEVEFAVPPDAVPQLLALCQHRLEKRRHLVAGPDGKTWEVDVFCGANQGLVLAEIELPHADESFERPGWLGAEVTDDSRYINACLARRPFSTWQPRDHPSQKT